MSPPMRHAALVGLMGAGKTSVGKCLAELLDLPFVDCDARISAATGKSIPEIFEADGEARFRRLESEILKDLLEADAPSVIATGGGVVLAERNRSLLRLRAVVCWLQAEPSVLAARVGKDSSRPLLLDERRVGGTEGRLAELAEERRRFYEEVADVSLATDDLSPADAAAALEGLIRSSLPSCPQRPSGPTQSISTQPTPQGAPLRQRPAAEHPSSAPARETEDLQ